MPRRQGVSRSMFASLPFELKQTLRSQSTDHFANKSAAELQVKAERLLDLSTDGLLSTQPPIQSESDSDDDEGHQYPIHLDLDGPSQIVKQVVVPPRSVEAGPSKLPVTISTSNTIVKSKRAELPLPHRDPYTYLNTSCTTSGTATTHAKRKKGKKPLENPLNAFIGHPFDCTGLVTRYTNYTDVPEDLMKYFAQRRLYFPLYDHLPLLLDRTGWFSITPQPIAAHIAERCACDLIIDAFCGVGGNSIEFAKTCERVIAIDNDLTRLKLARHNAFHHGVADRIEFIHGDFISFSKSFASRGKGEVVDVVFLSPPWGGIDYLNTPSATFPLSSILPIPGDDLFHITASLTPNIAYYLPRNTDLKELSTLAKSLECVHENDGNGRQREWVEVEEEWVGDKLKAITAYFGGLVLDD
ncbi:uncharacterized protein IL334_006630 [Kwoniella shivajii]|uniref:Trimethylguanosine synthase n=1 Tax=Kwoniella shivajii TaxID=564305 RepID=A0ABZ1D6H4_9TREE|nr:hypothetical protein IL334_006630 [Kwoniella shivajii]